jgi:hypothetical protein
VIYYKLSPQTNYIHFFIGRPHEQKGYAVIEESLFEWAIEFIYGEERYFTQQGERTFIGSRSEPETNEDSARKFLIDAVFGDEYDFGHPESKIYRNDL